MTNRIGLALVILTFGLIVPLDVGGQTSPTPQALVRQLGGADAIRVIEESLSDRREMGRFKPAGGDWITHKVSDTALTALLILTDQTPREYGFPHAKAFPAIPTTLGSAADGFCNDRDREVAIQKWRKWRAKNPMR